ncbi:hypothetical protein SUGI_1014710 [Cryptomeria japonica]|nr:hypothetical protein SUGI_1014710 [Cryptomeria japonica]
MAASSPNTAGQPKHVPRNASDERDPVASGQQVSVFDGLIIPPPDSVCTSAESSSRRKRLPYDIFINHHGGDAKHKIANSIYRSLDATGLRVLLDKDELKPGDFFPRALEEAMRSASLHIAIFSEHYAESPWCLAELAFMLETGTKFIPIFYHVDPATLRWAIKGKGRYAEALSKYEMKSSDEHEKKRRYSSEQLEHWKWALHKASFFTGHIINNQEDEQRVVKNVMNCVLKETNKVLFEVAKHPVGVDEAVLNFDKIAVQSDGSKKIVGIWALGGSGKTTLAKRIFNNKCSGMDRASFLFDLRDAAGKGLLVEKQKKLMKDLGVESESFDHVDEGKGILQSRLRSVSVLIILDDVDHTDQLDALLPARESLGQGSLIVVTTRELNVLKAWGISAIYKMEALSAIHAKELFCWHAFLQHSPLSGFEDLVEEFLNACKGLPLSLKVLGAQLYGIFDKNYWQSLLHKLSRILPDEIKLRLKVSYDALDDEEKEMFLDIACFFIGERKSVAIAVWEGSGWSGLHGWERLFNKCLVEVEDSGIGRMIWVNGGERIRMHDHLSDLGREVANGRSPYRLWSPQQSIKIHSQQEAIQIRGLANAIGDNCYLRQGNIIVHTSLGKRSLTLGSLGLKIFVGNGDFINQDQGEISRELVWLQCKDFEHENLPSWLSVKKLRVLELFNAHSLEGLWEREEDAPLQLRELVISECNSFREFPRSIGHLKNLKKIIVRHIVRGNDILFELPQEFCYLQSLEHLKITSCEKLSSLPNNFGELANLQQLNLEYCTKLKVLPDSFKNLTLLEHLNLDHCRELIINSESHVLENMTKLGYLNLNQCKKVEELRLPGVSPLTKLYLRGTSLKELPPNIFQLTKLTDLEIGSQFLQVLPSSVENLSSLTRLAIIWCKRLEALSDSLEHLNCLKDLVIEVSGVKCLPTLPATLKNIVVRDCSVLKDITGLQALRSLETLLITDCRELNRLPASFEGLTSLKKLRISRCSELEVLPSLSGITSLKEIDLKYDHKLKRVEGLENLISLEELEVHTQQNVVSVVKLEQCERLERVVVVTSDRSDVKPYISKIQKWPRDVMICTRAVVHVGSLKKFFEKLPNLSVVDYSRVVENRPESSANANAIIVL